VSDCVVLLLDGSCPHTAILTTQTIEILQEVHFEVLEHLCVARPSPFVLSLQFTQTSLLSYQFSED